MSNKNMEEKPSRGNGGVCNFISVKIKNGAQSHVSYHFTEKKMWTVNAKDVELLTVELAYDSEEITGIQHELNQLKQNSNINEMSRHEHIVKLEKLLQFKCKQW